MTTDECGRYKEQRCGSCSGTSDKFIFCIRHYLCEACHLKEVKVCANCGTQFNALFSPSVECTECKGEYCGCCYTDYKGSLFCIKCMMRKRIGGRHRCTIYTKASIMDGCVLCSRLCDCDTSCAFCFSDAPQKYCCFHSSLLQCSRCIVRSKDQDSEALEEVEDDSAHETDADANADADVQEEGEGDTRFRCGNHSIRCITCTSIAACVVCLEIKSENQSDANFTSIDLLMQCTACESLTRKLIADSGFPKDLQNEFYLYLFDPLAKARAVVIKKSE